MMLSGLLVSAAYSTLQSSITLNTNGNAVLFGSSLNPDGLVPFQNAFLGRILANGSFSMDGAQLRVMANGGGTTCAGRFFYRCYRQGSAAPAFTTIALTGPVAGAGSTFTWSNSSPVNLMPNLSTPGVYMFECYWNSTGNAVNNSCSTTFNDHNGGTYYQGYLEYCMTDAFSDFNFSANPTWNGDISDFTIIGTSDVSAADATQSNTLRLNAPASAGSRYISKPESNWSHSQSWSFWIGRRAQSYNSTNNVAIWLYANESNLESATVDGYRLFIGDNNGADELRLQSVMNNAPTNVIVSTTGVANNRTDVGFNVVISRSSTGVWTLRTSPMPTTNSSGQSANSNAFATSTVLQGTVTNTTYTPNGVGYMGCVVNHSNSTNASRAFELDNFYFTGGPAIACPATMDLALDNGCAVSVPTIWNTASLSYNSQMAEPIVFTQVPAAGTSLLGTGITFVTITATDARGHASSCQVALNRVDMVAPTISCPANLTANTSNGSCSAIVNYPTPVASDNCGNCISLPTPVGFTNLGTFNGTAYYLSNSAVTYAAAALEANANGGHLLVVATAAENTFVANAVATIGNNIWYWLGLNDATTEGTFQWVNGEPLTYSNWSAGEPNNSGNNEDHAHVWNNGLWNDLNGNTAIRFVIEKTCITPTLTQGLPSGSAFPVGVTTVSYAASDASGNSSSCSFTITVNDASAPSIVCPGNQSISLLSSCAVIMPDYRSLVSVSDNCTPTNQLNIIQSPAPGTVLSGPGTIVVTMSTSDANGNLATCSFNLAKADVIAPTLTCPTDIVVNATVNTCGAIVNFTPPTITDNCNTCNVGAAIAGFTYLGALGTTSYYVSTLATSFDQAQINCVSAGGYLASISSASENSIVRNAANALGIGSYGIGLTDQSNEGVWQWSNGEVLSYSNWNGGEPNNAGNEDYVQVYNNGLWNDIGGNQIFILEKPCLSLTQTAGLASGSLFPIGTTTISYLATDGSGNSSTCNFNVTIVDNTMPTLVCPSHITVTAPGGACSVAVNYGSITATDNCGNCASPLPITGFVLLGNYGGSAYYMSATPAATGAIALANCQTQGGYLATIGSVGENQFVRNAASSFGYGAFLIGYSDALTEGAFTWSNGQPTTYINWNAGEPNNSGNEDFTQVLINGLWNDISGNASYYVLERSCVPVTRTAGLASGSAFPVGTTAVTHQAIDASGNIATCSFNVTVNELVLPTIVCPTAQTLSLGGACTMALPDYRSLAVVADNCTPLNSLVITQNPAPGTIVGGIGPMSIQLTVRDVSNNTASCSFQVNKIDASAPTISCPANQTLYTNSSCQTIMPDYTNLVMVSDNCSAANALTRTQTPAAGTVMSGTGITNVTIQVSDGSGQISSCSFTVMRVDNTSPSITCPSIQTLVLNNDNTIVLPDYTSLGLASDACSASLIWEQSPAPGTIISGAGNHTITLTAADASNNVSNCQFVLETLAINTEIAFTNTEILTNENSGFLSLSLHILNPSPLDATVATIVTNGAFNVLNNDNSFTVVFPAGSSATQVLDIPLFDNAACSEDETIQFTISSVTGGYNAIVGSNNFVSAIVLDDEHERPVRMAEDFNTGIDTNWILSNANTWTATNSLPIEGTQSVQHNLNNVAGSSWLTYDLDNRLLQGVETTWQWQLDNMAQEPSPSNYFVFFLGADQTDLSQGVSGYAVGVRPATIASPDFLTLWRVQTGNVYVPLITTAIDVNATHGRMGIRVQRDENGLWTMWVDENGGFDSLSLGGSASDATYLDIHHFGVLFRHTASTAGLFKFDEINLTQKACGQVYYSQASGNMESALWSLQPIGTAMSAPSSPFNSYVIQSNHTVNILSDFAAKNLTVEPNGVLQAPDKRVYVFQDFAVQGHFEHGDGFLIFKGESDQTIAASADLNLNHVVIDNDGHSVLLPGNVKTNINQNKVLLLSEGSLQTNDQLVLKSSSIGTASIGEIQPNAQLNGRVTMERYIPTLNNYPYGSWVALGCAVSDQTVADWNDDMVTSGFSGSDFPPPYSFNNIQYYNESAAGNASNGYQGVSNINDVLQSNRGYFVFMQTPTQFVDVQGYVQQHDFNQPLSYTNTGHADDGWNLMVNQYPSEIDFRQLATNSAGVASYYLYDAEAANYKVYNGLAHVGTAPQFVAMNQSFFVQAAGPGSYLQYKEKYKTNQGTSWERTLPGAGYAHFQITGPSSRDECILYLNSEATGAFEYTLDARKMNSASATAVELAFIATDQTKLSIDSRNPSNIAAEIAMYCEMPAAGTYTFSIQDVVEMPFGTCYYIEDLITHETMLIAPGGSWSITVTEPFAGTRFIIHTQQEVQVVVSDSDCLNANNGMIQVTGAQTDWIEITSMANQTVLNATNVGTYGQLLPGDYLISIQPNITGCEAQEIGIQISAPMVPMAQLVDSEVATCNQENNGSLSIHWAEAAPYSYSLFDEQNQLVQSGTSGAELLEIAQLSPQAYRIHLVGECMEQDLMVDLNDPDAVMAGILSEDLQLTVSNGVAQPIAIYQNNINAHETSWMLNNELVQSEAIFELPFYAPGHYELSLLAFNDRCSAADTIYINVEQVMVPENLSVEVIEVTQTTQHVQIFANALDQPIDRIEIFDLNGKLVYSELTNLQKGHHFMPKGNWVTGIYSVVLYQGTQPTIRKIFITKQP
jgi:hypothetical protein